MAPLILAEFNCVISLPADRLWTSALAADSVELFNLAKDPSESENLAARNPEKVKELRARYDAYAAQALPPKAAPKPPGFKSPAVWGEQ